MAKISSLMRRKVPLPALRSFSISGLHGTQRLKMEFQDSVSIFLADNGSGKTTALFILQSVLKGDFSPLRRFSFQEITLEFYDGEVIQIKNSDLSSKRSHRGIERIVRAMSPRHVEYVYNLVVSKPLISIRNDEIFREAVVRSGLPTPIFYDRIHHYLLDREDLFSEGKSDSASRKMPLQEQIRAKFNHKVIYLPTYRRIEHDIQVFKAESIKSETIQDDLHFGMRDVHRKIEAIGDEIRKHAVASYSRTSGQMLSQLIETPEISNHMRSAVLNISDVETVLGRVGDNINPTDRATILAAVSNKSILNNKYLTLFVYELIEAYQSVNDRDMSLRNFANICNGYLIDKSFSYDNVRAKLSIISHRSGQELDLEMLSSGEKQILGMMSEIYLGSEDNYAIIFDEPELSLSVEWQRKILIDLTASKKCGFMVAATHSPFVFDNDLESHVRSLKVAYDEAD